MSIGLMRMFINNIKIQLYILPYFNTNYMFFLVKIIYIFYVI